MNDDNDCDEIEKIEVSFPEKLLAAAVIGGVLAVVVYALVWAA